MMQRVAFLIRHELRLEFRQTHTLAGIALFALAAVYLCYQAFGRLDNAGAWNGLIWLIALFTAFNAIGKGFQSQSRGLRLYLYTSVSPKDYILARLVYNMLLLTILGLFAFVAFLLFLGAGTLSGGQWWMYVLGLLAGNLGFASLLTLVSAIAGQSSSGIGLTAVLGLPMVIPLILLINAYSSAVLSGIPFDANAINLFFILVLTLGMFALSYLLFPYLWRD